MAQKIITQLVSDVSGKELKDGKGETVTFALDGTQYELDLSNKEADDFRGIFQEYIAAGRKVGAGKRTQKRAGSTGGSGRSKEELADIRAWATENGYEVSERGRIKQAILDAYDAA